MFGLGLFFIQHPILRKFLLEQLAINQLFDNSDSRLGGIHRGADVSRITLQMFRIISRGDFISVHRKQYHLGLLLPYASLCRCGFFSRSRDGPCIGPRGRYDTQQAHHKGQIDCLGAFSKLPHRYTLLQSSNSLQYKIRVNQGFHVLPNRTMHHGNAVLRRPVAHHQIQPAIRIEVP